MSIYVIGDIHGCLKSLKAILKSITFEKNDLLITLGDYIDRGPSSFGVLEFLSEYYFNPNRIHQFVPILGNHEEFLFKARKRSKNREVWLFADGKMPPHLQNAVRRSKTEGLDLLQVSPKHWSFLENCVSYYEIENYIFSHAPLNPHKKLKEHKANELSGNKALPRKKHISDKINIFGHIPQDDGRPLNLKHAINLDTHASSIEGFLTCLNLTTFETWRCKNNNNDDDVEKQNFENICKTA